MSELVAPYISKAEFSCHHCGMLPPDLETNEMYDILFRIFASIRESWGKPIVINSGFRCPLHNASIGGSPISVHLFGLALDLDCVDEEEVAELYELINMLEPDLRIGQYKQNETFIHIDMGYVIDPRASSSWVEGVRWYK